jgi:predicted nucleic-acid-binding protein
MDLIKIFSYFTFNKYVVKAYRSSDGWLHDNIDEFLVSEYLYIKEQYDGSINPLRKRDIIEDNKKIIIEAEKIFRKASPSFISTLI